MSREEAVNINTDSMRKAAKSVKYGQGTREGSLTLMLIDCCDHIDRLTAELKAKDEIIQVVLRNVKAGAVTTQWVESYIEQALKGE